MPKSITQIGTTEPKTIERIDFIIATSFKIIVFQMLMLMANTFSQNDALI